MTGRTGAPPIAPPPLPTRTRLAARAGRAVGALSRRLGIGGGGVIGGRVSLALDPAALSRLSAGRRSALVSGTNGKTTTTRLLAAALCSAGPVATNSGGANLPYGLVAALSGAPAGGTAALEVDEAYLGRVIDAVRPDVVCLLNLSRDQLDRINEVRMLAGRWRSALTAGAAGVDGTAGDGPVVVANADDPMVVWAAGAAPRVVWVGAGLSWTLDAVGCPACEGRVEFSAGDWSCSCGFRRPVAQVRLEGDSMIDASGVAHPIRISLPGRCNRANAAMAATAAGQLGVDPDVALRAMEPIADVTGRYGVVQLAGVPARLLLSKNPAGWMEIFDFLRPPPAPAVVAINARVADGRDPSWLWDVPFERLAGRTVVATGERCRDLAVRLRYAEVDHLVVEDLSEAVRVGGGLEAGSDLTPPVLDVVGNYTAFQALRKLADGA